MSELVVAELVLLLRAMKLGIWIAVVYDLLRIFRRIIEHNIWTIGLEDGLYWCYVGIEFFRLLYEHNEGRLRWYLIAGAMLGMLLYSMTIGKIVVRVCSKVICRIKRALRETYNTTKRKVSKPVKSVTTAYRVKYLALQSLWTQQNSKCRKHIRNKLTRLKKMIKIVLCKQ